MALTANDLTEALGISAEEATRVLPVAVALVEQYAPAAPTGVKDEGTIRVAGWLSQQPKASIRSESAGPLSISYATAEKSALSSSGAMGLLTHWKKRRAGGIP